MLAESTPSLKSSLQEASAKGLLDFKHLIPESIMYPKSQSTSHFAKEIGVMGKGFRSRLEKPLLAATYIRTGPIFRHEHGLGHLSKLLPALQIYHLLRYM